MLRLPARCLLLLVVTLLVVGSTKARADAPEPIIDRARAEDLAGQRAWRFLLHAREGHANRRSQVDDPDFFLAPEGNRDPAAELEATLNGFFLPADLGNPHPRCRYPARFHWLNEQLDLAETDLPEPTCTAFEDWKESLGAPRGATLIFPAAYLNNPSSMYGHTLLRLDREGQDRQTKMLSPTVNYAADPGNDGGIAFAFKGIAGFYPGTFSIAPYHEKIKLYNDMESRDIWEYRLDLEPAEVDQLVRHVWEMRGVRFDYYFFSENCSSQLLALLEVARPSLDLSEEFDLWAIPADTVKAVRRAGLVEGVDYRPALATRVRERARALEAAQAGLARQCSRGSSIPEDALSRQDPEAAARILDLAYLDLRHRYREGEASREDLAGRGHELLVQRAATGVPDNRTPLTEPRVRPDDGHGSARAALGFGSREGGAFQSIRLRATYHDILDPEGGFIPGARINFADLHLRHYTDAGQRERRLEVERFDIIDIVSLAPRGPFIRGLSWRVTSGYHRYPVGADGDPGNGPGVWRTRGGTGMAWLAGPARPYLFAESAVDIGGGLDPSAGAGLGGRLGLYLDTGKGWRWNLEAGGLRFAAGATHNEAHLRLRGRWTLGRNHALRIQLERRRTFDHLTDEAELSWHVYF